MLDTTSQLSVAQNLFQWVLESRWAMTQYKLVKYIFQELVLFLWSYILQVGIKVVFDKPWTTYDHTLHFLKLCLVITCEVILKGSDDLVKEFVLGLGMLHGCCRAFVLSHSLFDFSLVEGLVVGDGEDISDTVLHGDSDEMSLVKLLDHLVQSPHV